MRPNWLLFKFLVGVLAISFSPVFVKWVSVPPTVSAFYRTFNAACLLGLIMIPGFKKHSRAFSWSWAGWPLLAGLFLAVDLILWHKTIIMLGAGPATLLGNSQVIFVSLFMIFFFKEKVHPLFWLLMPLVFLGLYWAIPERLPAGTSMHGLIMGVLVGLTYAGFLMGLRMAHDRGPGAFPEVINLFLIMLTAAVLIGTYLLVVENGHLLGYGRRDYLIMLAMALVAQVAGWLLIQATIVRMPGHQGSLLLLLQPLLAIIWGRLFFNEPLQLRQLLGIALALGSIAFYQGWLAPRGAAQQVIRKTESFPRRPDV